MANYKYEELNFDQKMTFNVIIDLLERINSKTTEMSYLDNNYLGSYLGYQAQLPILKPRLHTARALQSFPNTTNGLK